MVCAGAIGQMETIIIMFSFHFFSPNLCKAYDLDIGLPWVDVTGAPDSSSTKEKILIQRMKHFQHGNQR